MEIQHLSSWESVEGDPEIHIEESTAPDKSIKLERTDVIASPKGVAISRCRGVVSIMHYDNLIEIAASLRSSQ